MPSFRVLPLVIAVALFMENMDSTVIATSLPAIAADLGTSPVALKLALTSYLLALAIFIPVSGWAADRFGARRVFRAAIVVFVIGSVACGFAQSLPDFVAARIVQGMGGAMMTPVGRLVLLRSIPKSDLVDAMAWFTIPALMGPLVGPPLGGFISTYLDWRWIFWINVPIGALGILLATRFVPDISAEAPGRLDIAGFLLAAASGGGIVFGASIVSLEEAPVWIGVVLLAGGAAASLAYLRHARRAADPILDLTLLRLPTFRASVVGGSLFRVGVGAIPFLLPLLLQLGFGMTPFQSGLVTLFGALGAAIMKGFAARIVRRFGFRPVLLFNTVASTVFLGFYALFTPETPPALIAAALLAGGFFRSLQFTSVNTIAYADVEPAQMSRATSLASVAQQISLSLGVALAAAALEVTGRLSGEGRLGPTEFATAFLVVAAVSLLSLLSFARLPREAGAAMAGRIPAGEDRIAA